MRWTTHYYNSIHLELTARLGAELIPIYNRLRLLLASPQPPNAKYMNEQGIFKHMQATAYMAPYLLVDLGASFTPIVEQVVGLCNEVLIVVEPVPQTVLQTKSLIDDLIEKGIASESIDVVLVNRIRSGMQLSWSQVQDQLGRPISVLLRCNQSGLPASLKKYLCTQRLIA